MTNGELLDSLLEKTRSFIRAAEDLPLQMPLEPLRALWLTSVEFYLRCATIPETETETSEPVSPELSEDELSRLREEIFGVLLLAETYRQAAIRSRRTRGWSAVPEADLLEAAQAISTGVDYAYRIQQCGFANGSLDALWLARFSCWGVWGTQLLSAIRTLHRIINPLVVSPV